MSSEQRAPTKRALIAIVIGSAPFFAAAPAFADSPPNVWEQSDVYAIGAMIDGGDTPVSFDSWHQFAYWRDNTDSSWQYIDSAHDGLGRHNFWVGLVSADQRHAMVSGRNCWHTFLGQTHCGPWGATRDVWGAERPGFPGALMSEASPAMCVDDRAKISVCNGSDSQRFHINQWKALQSNTNMCLYYNDPVNGSPVTTGGPIDNMITEWDFTNVRIKGLRSMCADAGGTNPSVGQQAQMWDCNDSGAQLFTFVGWSHEIRTPGDKCLDVYDTNNGTAVKFWDCNGYPNQKWYIGSNGEIRGLGNKCLEVAGFDINNGAKLQIWDCWGGPNQKFYLQGELRSYQNKCLDVPRGNYSPNTSLQTWDCWGGDNQHFIYSP